MGKLLKLFLALILLFIFIGKALAGEKYKVSVKNISLKKIERVEWFTLKYKGCHVISFPNVPEDWLIKITDWAPGEQPRWTGRVDGSIHLGSDAVNIHFFENFILLETDSDNFDLELTICITDGDDERKIKLAKNKLFLAHLTEAEITNLKHPNWGWGSD